MYYLSTDEAQTGGGSAKEAIVYSKTDRNLTEQEAFDLLLHAQEDSVTSIPPYRPSAGSVFVYNDDGDAAKTEDQRCDRYTWRNYGKRIFQKR